MSLSCSREFTGWLNRLFVFTDKAAIGPDLRKCKKTAKENPGPRALSPKDVRGKRSSSKISGRYSLLDGNRQGPCHDTGLYRREFNEVVTKKQHGISLDCSL